MPRTSVGKKNSRQRKRVNYEVNTPHCANCIHYRKAAYRLTTDSMTKGTPHHCVLNKFNVQPTALCNKWEGSNGDKLEEES